jgi:hypothetical protein
MQSKSDDLEEEMQQQKKGKRQKTFLMGEWAPVSDNILEQSLTHSRLEKAIYSAPCFTLTLVTLSTDGMFLHLRPENMGGGIFLSFFLLI